MAADALLPLPPVRNVPRWARWVEERTVESQKPVRRFYVDGESGRDAQDGQTPDSAWKTLDRVRQLTLQPGDQILFRRGCRFEGALLLDGVKGSPEAFIRIGAYGPESAGRPVIDGKGTPAAVLVKDGQYLKIEDLEITADSGKPLEFTDELLAEAEELADKKWVKRVISAGVEITARDQGATEDIYLKNLLIHSIFPDRSSPSEGKIKITHYGYGVHIHADRKAPGTIRNIAVDSCTIKNTGHFGIVTGGGRDARVENVIIQNSRMERTGGSGVLLGWVEHAYVQGNVIYRSGSFDDARKHGRGSGSWTFAASDVIYENNVIMHARGKGDSAGIHIDFNSTDVVVQRNLSVDNEGGFVEILGNNYNSVYRYNISVNDGSRVKGENGAFQQGKIFWLSGHCMEAPKGPFDSYIYNNTVFVKEDLPARFAVVGTADGVLVANNIFYLTGDTEDVLGDQDTMAKWAVRANAMDKTPQRDFFENNVYARQKTIPETLKLQDNDPVVGDPEFRSPGGLRPEDYIPANRALLQNKGIRIKTLRGSHVDPSFDLEVEVDFFGNPIRGRPDIGAIELPL